MSDIEINPDDPTGQASANELKLARAAAIEAYAQLEQSMCMLFSQLLRTSIDLAAVVFYTIVSTHQRNTVLEGLFKKTGSAAYSDYFKNWLKEVRSIDQRRHEIVHWHMAGNTQITAKGQQTTYELVPGNFSPAHRPASVPPIAPSFKTKLTPLT
jgi:hypothetical protein